jgi:hypothetical protein
MGGEDDARPVRRKGGGRGFARAAAALTPALRAAAGSRGIAEHRLLTDWDAVVGPEFAALCRPVRIEHRPRRGDAGLGGTLVVAAGGAVAPEVLHLAAVLVERVNAAYGYRAVSRLRLSQTETGWGAAAVAAAEPPAPFAAAPSPLISTVADEGLRAALARLEANIRRRADRPRTQGPRP